MHDRHQIAAQLQHTARADQVADLGALRAQTFDDGRERHDVSFVSDLNHHAFHHRQCERQSKRDRHAAGFLDSISVNFRENNLLA